MTRGRKPSMNQDQIKEAEIMRQSGKTVREISSHFGVKTWTIYRILDKDTVEVNAEVASEQSASI